MFARTKRLTLRPCWPEDAAALCAAIAHEDIVRMLMRVPWPYTLADASSFAARPRSAAEPRFQIIAHDLAVPTLIGGIDIMSEEDGPQLGYWITPGAWGRGYATEAGRAVVDMARHCLPLATLNAWHFEDNPRSGAVLRKLGFSPTGRIVQKQSRARRHPAAAIEYSLDVDDRTEADLPIAA